MSEGVRQRATPSPPTVRVVEPLIEVLAQNRRGRPTLPEQAAMSRARFAVSQATSVLVAFLTCFSLIVISLIKMDNLQALFSGPCGLLKLVLEQLNMTSPETLNETCPASSLTQ